MDVTKLTPEQTRNILDFVLENAYHPEDYFDFKNKILPRLITEKLFPDNDEYLLQMALNQLKRDSYIDFIEEAPNSKIKNFNDKRSAGEQLTIRRNFAGHIFLANGGYNGEEKRKIAKTAADKATAERDEGYASGLLTWTQNLANRTADLTFWTRLVAFGAIGLVLWEVVAFAIEHHWFSYY